MAKVLVRMETAEGMKSYMLDGEVVGESNKAVWKDLISVCPPMLKPLLEGFMFAARHGPLQKLLREKGLPPMCKDCSDKNAEAVRAFTSVLFHTAHEEQVSGARPGEELLPFDIFQRDLADASKGMIERVPQYDGLARVEAPEKAVQAAIAEATPAV